MTATKTPPPPTGRQREVLAWIRAYRDSHGYTPTFREIGRGIGVSSPNGVVCHLSALRKKGLITWDDSLSRTIKLLEDA